MTIAILVLVIVLSTVGIVALFGKLSEARKHAADAAERNATISKTNMELAKSNSELRMTTEETKERISRLVKYETIADAEEAARKQLDEARAAMLASSAAAHRDAAAIRQHATEEAERSRMDSEELIAETKQRAQVTRESAQVNAEKLIEAARLEAKEIAGGALDARDNAKKYERAVEAIKNVIDGYGNRYLIPGRSVLDELADQYGQAQAGEELRLARERTRGMVINRTAASCDYVENNRRETAISFVVDAFNGKVDSVLSRVRYDNFGKLQQEIKDAFSIVNIHGEAFRNARITDVYLKARLEELKWAVAVEELRRQDREEQRIAREQAREDEKVRREIERARVDAERQQAELAKRIVAAQEAVAKASEEQKAKYEGQLRDLGEKLRLAQEAGQRALSMAQQTKKGTVYIISNVGSFGDHVYKIGLTRRLRPQDRIDELGDASVPFDFDVHAMIESEDAPALERRLHRHFTSRRMNKINLRREYFQVTIDELRQELEQIDEIQKLTVRWTMAAEAREFHESRAITGDPARLKEWVRHRMEGVPLPSEREVSEAVSV